MNKTIKPLKFFYCPDIPNHDDIEYARQIVEKEDCYVQINYTGPARYAYSLAICPGDSHEDIFNRLPKVYGL